MTRFHFDYIGRKKIWFGSSGLIIALGLLAIMLGGLRFGVEFQGGNQYNVNFSTAPTVAAVRQALEPMNLGNSTIQPVGTGREFQIRTPRLSDAVQKRVKDTLTEKFKVKDISTRDIGPGWGKQVTDGAIKALIASLLVILLYISIRFEFKMAIAVMLALIHDGLIVVGVYAIMGFLQIKLGFKFIPTEVTPNTVAALLTILGFSLYDTIVVFHRIKENTELIGKRTYSAMANDSINQVIMRSVNTSLTEVVPVIALLFFGGETLKDFGFAMLVGLMSGVYSSIFIACPALAMLKEMEPRYRMIREKLGRAEPSRKKKRSGEGSDSSPASPQAGSDRMTRPGAPAADEGADMSSRAEATDLAEAMVPTPKQKTAAQKAKKKAKKKKRR